MTNRLKSVHERIKDIFYRNDNPCDNSLFINKEVRQLIIDMQDELIEKDKIIINILPTIKKIIKGL